VRENNDSRIDRARSAGGLKVISGGGPMGSPYCRREAIAAIGKDRGSSPGPDPSRSAAAHPCAFVSIAACQRAAGGFSFLNGATSYETIRIR